jgi:hypothetical protein
MIGRRIVGAEGSPIVPQRGVTDAAQEAERHEAAISVSVVYATESRWVMAAQIKPTSSRATAATAMGGRLPWPTRWR